MANLPNGARPRARSWSDTGEAPPPPSRRRRLFVVALVLLALAAVLVVLALLPSTLGEPFLLSFPVTEYHAPQLPVNAYARADSEALRQVFRNSEPVADSQTRQLLESDLDGLRKNSSPTVVVHLSALARANDTEYGLTAGIFSEDEDEIARFFDRIEAGVAYANRRTGATTGAWPGVQSFCGWKASGSTGKGGCGPYYVAQFLREQSRTIVR